jgi:O-antigen/teichoic acid export membrane protein
MPPLDTDAKPEDRLEVAEPLLGVPADEPESLRTKTARGTIVNGAFMIGIQTLGLLKGFVIAAFLTQGEYGVWGILVITVGTLTWLKDVGIGDKYVQQDDADQERAFQRAFSIDLLANVALAVLVAVALPLFALAYGHWSILAPGLVIAATLPVQSFKTPSWIFYRDMRFGRQRLLEAVDPVASFAVTIVLALAGLGYWSLILGLVAGNVAGAIVAVWVAPYRMRFRIGPGVLREYWSFSWPIFVASASGLMIPQVAMLSGTRTLGLAGAGMIALAGTVGVYTDKVDELVTWTLYPAICRVKDRTELLLEAFVKSNRLALMWGVPFGVAVTLFASDVVHYGIGEQWRPAVGLIQVFGLTAAANHIGFNWTAFLSARGNTRPLAVMGPIVLAAFLLTALPGMLAFGLDGFAAGMAFMTFVSLLVRGYYLRKLFSGFNLLTYALRSVAPTAPAVAAVLLVRAAEPSRSIAAAIGEVVLYVAVTAGVTWMLERPLLREALAYVRGRGRPPVPSAA